MTPATRPRRAPTGRVLRALLVSCISASGLAVVAPASVAAVPCAQRNDVTIPVRTFHVVAEWSKKSYRVGETAKLDITVTRPSHQDPATDEGNELPVEPPVVQPGSEVTVGVGVYIGQVFLSGGGITDADGHLLAKVKVQKYAKPGPAAATIYAYKRYLTDTRCVYLQEFAYLRQPDAFKVTK
ncbi:MAG TPA: hypothetical protein VIG64_09025 [Actinomycetota bacterium]